MVATNSGLWYAGDKPVVAAYNKGVQVYPLAPVGKTYNIYRSAVGVFDLAATSPGAFSHYNSVSGDQLSGYRYGTWFRHDTDIDSYYPTRNIGVNFWDHMEVDGSGATPGYEAVNCYRRRDTTKPNPSANWYEYQDFRWSVGDLSNTPEYLIKMLNLDFSFTNNSSFISSSSLYHCYPYDYYHLHGTPNRTITTDDVVDLKLTQKDYLGFGNAWGDVAPLSAQQTAWIQVDASIFTWTDSDGAPIAQPTGTITFMLNVWGDGNDLEAPENPRGVYPLPA